MTNATKRRLMIAESYRALFDPNAPRWRTHDDATFDKKKTTK